MLDLARQFAVRVAPWPEDGQSGYINLHWSSIGTNKKKFWDGRATTTPDEFIRTLNWVSRNIEGADIYICMSRQALMEPKVAKVSQREYKKAARLSTHALGLKSLYIDVDVKPDAYATQKDALKALKSFITTMGMPEPTACVASGSGGFHAHWILDRVLTRPEWQKLSGALATATQTHGLMTDAACTIDSARILRVPETLNHKTIPPKPVTLMAMAEQDIPYEVMFAALEPYINLKVSASDDFVMPRGTNGPVDNSEYGAGVEDTPTIEIKLEEVAKSCAFIANSVLTGGADNTQPLWFMTANLASFIENGREALHLMSKKHAGYSHPDTDDLFDRTYKNRESRDFGWPKCKTIEAAGCKDCATCPHFGQGKSPFNFGLHIVQDTTELTLPDKYIRNPDGIVMVRSVDDKGVSTATPISEYPITHGWLSNEPWTLHFMSKTSVAKKTPIEIPCEVITAKEGLAKMLGAKGFFCNDQQLKSVKEFLLSWIQKLQKNKDSVVSGNPFGWSIVDGKIEGFAYGGRVWTDGSDRPSGQPDPVLAIQYTPRGLPAVWEELSAVIYKQQRPALNAILAVAFAGPLVHFTGFPGLILNSYSPESGIGKTTAMKVSQAVWGHPKAALQGLNDTANSIINKMGRINSLPVYWDEIKSEAQTKRFCSIVFEITGGKEKSRLNADATLRASGTWQTMLVSASNDSLVDSMAKEVGSTTAGLHRLFEYVVPPGVANPADIGAIQRLVGKLEDNFAHAGLAYAKFLGKNHKRVEQEIAEFTDLLFVELEAKQEERMWVATIAVLLKGAEYANELKLLKIDLKQLRAFLATTMHKMREEVNQSASDLTTDLSMSSVLGEFLNTKRARNTLWTDKIWMSKGNPGKNIVKVVRDASRLEELHVHIGVDSEMIRFNSKRFTDFCNERGYSRQTFVERLKKDFGGRLIVAKLGGGTDYSVTSDNLIEIDMNDVRLKPFIL